MNNITNMSSVSDSSSIVNNLHVIPLVLSSFVNNINHIIETLPFTSIQNNRLSRRQKSKISPSNSITKANNTVHNVNNCLEVSSKSSEMVIDISDDLLSNPIVAINLSNEDIPASFNSDDEAKSLSQGAATPSWAFKTPNSVDSNEATTTVSQQETSQSEEYLTQRAITVSRVNSHNASKVKYIRVLIIWLSPPASPSHSVEIALVREADGALNLVCGEIEDESDPIAVAIQEIYLRSSIRLTADELMDMGMERYTGLRGLVQVFLSVRPEKREIQSEDGNLGKWVTATQYLHLWRQRIVTQGGRDQLKHRNMGYSVGQFLFPDIIYATTGTRVQFGGQHNRPKVKSMILPEYIWEGQQLQLENRDSNWELSITSTQEGMDTAGFTEESFSTDVPLPTVEENGSTNVLLPGKDVDAREQEMICIIIANTEIISPIDHIVRSVLSDMINNILSNQVAISTGNRVYFYEAGNVMGYNSNFYISPMIIEGELFQCNESYFMCKKLETFDSLNTKLRDQIMKETNPSEIKRLGKLVNNFDETIWDKVKYNIMSDGLRHKFWQNNVILEQLLSTAPSIIYEAAPYDRVWGIGFNEGDARQTDPELYGQNLLGRALMDIRDNWVPSLVEKGVETATVVKKCRIELVRGDITLLGVDAIVNSTNGKLLGGGGVDRIIHRAAGPELAKECQMSVETFGECPIGEVRLTSGHNISSQIIHVRGPQYNKDQDVEGLCRQAETLRKCYRRVLEMAESKYFKTLAICSISTLVGGYPMDQACTIALDECQAWLTEGHHLDKILFSPCTDDEELAYAKVMRQYFLSDKSEPEWCQMIEPKCNKKLSKDGLAAGIHISRGEGLHNVFFSRLLNYEGTSLLNRITAEQSHIMDAAEALVRSRAINYDRQDDKNVRITNRSVDFQGVNSNIFEQLNMVEDEDEISIDKEFIGDYEPEVLAVDGKERMIFSLRQIAGTGNKELVLKSGAIQKKESCLVCSISIEERGSYAARLRDLAKEIRLKAISIPKNSKSKRDRQQLQSLAMQIQKTSARNEAIVKKEMLREMMNKRESKSSLQEWSDRKPTSVSARDLSLGRRITVLSLRRTKQVLTEAEVIVKYVPRESALLDHMDSFDKVIAQLKTISVGEKTVKQFRALRQMIAEGAISRMDCRNLPRERQRRSDQVRQSGSLLQTVDYIFIDAKETYIHNHWLDNGYAELLGEKLQHATWQYTDENPWIFREMEFTGITWEKMLDAYGCVVPRVSRHSDLQWAVDIYRYISDTFKDGITSEVRSAIRKVEVEKMLHIVKDHTYNLFEESNAAVLLAMNENLSEARAPDSCLSYIKADITDGDPFTNDAIRSMTIAVLIDGGASINVITPELVERLGIPKVESSYPVRVKNAGGTVTECGYKCRVYITTRGDIVRDIWDKALPYDSKNMTLGVDCTILEGCPVSMILGSHAMKVFNILDDKCRKQAIMGNDEGRLVVSHMTDLEWMACNRLTKMSTSPVNVILNQLDQDMAESNYRNSIVFIPPSTHRLAVLVALLKSTNLDRLSKGEISALDGVDVNEISVSSIKELAVRLNLTKGSVEALIKEVEMFGKKSSEALILEHKEVSVINSLVSAGKLLGTVSKSMGSVGKSMWGSLVNLISSEEKEIEGEASTNVDVETSLEITDATELKAYAKIGLEAASKLSKSAKVKAKLAVLARMKESKGVDDEDISDEIVLEARIQAAAAKALFEEACEAERVKVINETVAHKLTLRSAIEASRVIIEEWGMPIDDDISLLAEDYSLSSLLEGKPELFPTELWKYVADDVKPLVAARYARYPAERLLEITQDLMKIDICKERPASLPYVKAQAFANIDVYYHIDEENVPNVPGFEMQILTSDEVPVVAKSYKQHPFLERLFLDLKTEDLVRRRILEKSESSWRSPVLLVEYPDRIKTFMAEHFSNIEDALLNPLHRKIIMTFFRFTMNLIMLNEKTLSDQHPMPSMKHCIESFVGATHYSCGDVADAFWVVSLAAKDRHKTAFATHNKLLQWRVSVQGSRNAAVFFARLIATVFARVPGSITVYQDDIFVHTVGIKPHLECQQIAYDRMRDNSLVFKMSKSRLNYPRLKILGHVLTSKGRAPDPEKIRAILDLAIPTTPKMVRELVGMAQFNAEYIHNLSTILAPLHDIMHDDCDMIADWKDEVHGKAFRDLKLAFTNAPLLAMPELFKPYRIFVDTCTTHGRGIGAILCQWHGEAPYDPDNKDVSGENWRPVAYWSKLLNKSQRMYSATEAEAKGMHDAILHWAPYLKVGRFEVICDHKALEYIFNSPNITANRRVLHYALDLMGFNYRVLYKSGKEHLNADGLSRLYRYEDVLDTEQIEEGNFDTVTATDIRVLADKLLLDEAKYQQLMYPTSTVNMMEMLPDDEEGRSFEWVQFTSVEEGVSMKHELISLINTTIRNKNYARRMNYLMSQDEEYMASINYIDNDDSEEDPYDHYDRLPPPVYPEEYTEGSTEMESDQLYATIKVTDKFKVDDGQSGDALKELINDGAFCDAMQSQSLEMSRNGILRVDQHGPAQDPMEVHYVNLDAELECDDEEDWGPTHMRVHNLLHGTVSYVPVFAMSTRNRGVPTQYHGKGKITNNDDQVSAKLIVNRDKFLNKQRNHRLRRQNIQLKQKSVSLAEDIESDTGTEVMDQAELDNEVDVVEDIDVEDEGVTNAKISRKEARDLLIQAKLDTKAARNKIREDRKRVDDMLKANRESNKEEAKRIKDLVARNKELAKANELEDKAKQKVINRNKAEAELALAKEEKRLQRQTKIRDLKELQKNVEDIEGNRVLRAAGPKMIQVSRQINIPEYAFETEEQQTAREVGEARAIELSIKLLGSIYKDPRSDRLYEVVSIYWDAEAQLVCARRTPADDGITSSDDMESYVVEGVGGIEDVVMLYNERAGYLSSVKWPTTEQEMRLLQLADPILSNVIIEIEAGERRYTSTGRLYIIPLKVDGTKGALRVMAEQEKATVDIHDNTCAALPSSLLKSVLRYYHEGLGHCGTSRMVESLRLKYWWDGMQKHVTRHVHGCLLCRLRKADRHQGLIPMRRYATSLRPMQRVHIDLVGPFQESYGYKYILVAKCPLTQWIEMVPLMTKTCGEVTKAITNNVLMVHGGIEVLITDNGKEFIGDTAGAIHYLLNNVHHRTTPYRPEANGEVENQNATLKDSLSMLISENQRDWVTFLPVLLFAYRTTVNASTGFSPFRCLYGREARQPSEQWIEDFKTTSQDTIDTYVEKLSKALLFTWREAGTKIMRNQEKVDDISVGKRVRIFVPYQVGDYFFLKTIAKRWLTEEGKKTYKLTRKLQMRYTGPHLVIEVKNPVIYKVMVNGRERMVHASKMKRDPAANRVLEVYEDDILDMDDVDVEYENMNDIEVEEMDINEDGDYINDEGDYVNEDEYYRDYNDDEGDDTNNNDTNNNEDYINEDEFYEEYDNNKEYFDEILNNGDDNIENDSIVNKWKPYYGDIDE